MNGIMAGYRQEVAAWQARRETCAATNPAHTIVERTVEMPSGQYSHSEGPYVAVRRLTCPRCTADPAPIMPQEPIEIAPANDPAYASVKAKYGW